MYAGESAHPPDRRAPCGPLWRGRSVVGSSLPIEYIQTVIAPDKTIKEIPTSTVMSINQSERLAMAGLIGKAVRPDSCANKPTTAITINGMDAIKSPRSGIVKFPPIIELSGNSKTISIRKLSSNSITILILHQEAKRNNQFSPATYFCG